MVRLLSYLKADDLKRGLPIDSGECYRLTDGIKRDSL